MFEYINIVIPVYNEEGNIANVLQELNEKVKTPHRIFIVYDFDEDTTLAVIRKFQKHQDNIFFMKNKYGNGVVNALKTGLKSLDGVILVIMGDLSDELAKIDLMYAKIMEGYDIVCGSRYVRGGRQIDGPVFKGFLSRMAGLSLYYFAGIPTHDVTNSFKMYTKKVIDSIKIESNGGFEIGMEIVLKAHFKGFKVTEVPSVSLDRVAGESKFRLIKWLPKYLYWYFWAFKHRIIA
jgi:dolichol-phosphate mannosyltransferase